MRSAYSLAAEKAFPKYPVTTYVLLGEEGLNRGKYNMTYPKETNDVLDVINKYINENM